MIQSSRQREAYVAVAWWGAWGGVRRGVLAGLAYRMVVAAN